MKLSFQTWGSPENPAILMLHGFMGFGTDWTALAENLRAGYFCIAPDLPGHGASSIADLTRANAFQVTARAVVDLLNNFKIDEAVLLGYSLGGRLAWYTAIEYPRRLRGLIIESAAPGLKTEAEKIERIRLDLERAREIKSRPFPQFLNTWFRQPLFRTMQRQPQRLSELIQSRLMQDPQALAAGMDLFSIGRQPSYWDRCRELNAPVMLIAGAQDEKYRRATGEIAATSLKRSTVRIIPAVGHNSHWEAPALFLDAIKTFLQTELKLTRSHI